MATAAPPAALPDRAPAALPATRLASVDVLRGLVMVVMALDHVRDHLTNVPYAPEDLAQTSVPLFLTRWITHFCAPVFVLLAGTGAGLSEVRGKPRGELARFLWTRGLWLIVAELTIVRFGWAFNLEYRTEVWVQVIWVIGVSMILLAPMLWLPRWVVGAIGVVMIAGHNLLDGIGLDVVRQQVTLGNIGQLPTLAGASLRDWAWATLHVQYPPIIYPLIPWPGVMFVGYALAPLFLLPAAARHRLLLALGLGATALFLLVRGLNIYGDPAPWSAQPRAAFTVLSFLNTTKYPPSLSYLLMTLGPALALLVPLERLGGWLGRVLETIGRVPFFYYVVHLYLIHLVMLGLGVAAGYPLGAFLHPWFLKPAGFGFGLGVVYAAWLAVVAALYPLCRWFAGVKARRRDLAWLSYL